MNLSGKRVIVVGLGKSGLSAAELCLAHGAQVLGTDSRSLAELSPTVSSLSMQIVVGGHASVDFTRCDLVVISPGVPSFEPLERAERAGIPVVSEIELASWFVTAPLFAIGGTNGKSTTTTLLSDILGQAGKRVFAGGNLGEPLSRAARPLSLADWQALVVEVSSFQLERVASFRPHVAVLLNITADHLDRYPDFAAYANAKGNVFVRQEPDDLAIVSADDPECERQCRRGRARVITFGSRGDYVVLDDGVLETRTGTRFDTASSRLEGAANRQNAAAAIAAARSFGVDEQAIASALQAFSPLKHRLGLVATVDGVRYYDDSKATNVGAAVVALQGLRERFAVLIAGGRDKLGSYEPLIQALRDRGRALVVIGEAKQRIVEAAGDSVPVFEALTLEDAVNRARDLAQPGDAVLLSPACSSFDMFQSYADRGDAFARAVSSLEPRVTPANVAGGSVDQEVGQEKLELPRSAAGEKRS